MKKKKNGNDAALMCEHSKRLTSGEPWTDLETDRGEGVAGTTRNGIYQKARRKEKKLIKSRKKKKKKLTYHTYEYHILDIVAY